MIKNYKKLTTEESLYIIEKNINVGHMFCNMNACYVPEHVDVESLINERILDDSYVFVKPTECTSYSY